MDSPSAITTAEESGASRRAVQQLLNNTIRRVRTDLGQLLVFFTIVVILTGVVVFAMGLITAWQV